VSPLPLVCQLLSCIKISFHVQSDKIEKCAVAQVILHGIGTRDVIPGAISPLLLVTARLMLGSVVYL
jgi:hypothetical protein